MSETKVNISHIEKTSRPKNLIGARHLQAFLMFITLFLCFGMRTCLSVAIISMTEESSPDPSIPTYPEWDDTDIILSSFFWGYILTQVGAGQLGEYFGPKWFLCGTITAGSVVHMLIPPMAAAMGSSGVMICRVLQGLCQGFLYPSITNLMSRWAPIFERTRISNFVFGGAALGTAFSMPMTGAITGSNLGWPVAFYTFGALGVAWGIIFGFFGANSPSTHRSISLEEKLYIESNTAINTDKKKLPTPWGSIFTSLPVWAVAIAGAAQCWGGWTLLTEIPSYLDGIAKFNIHSNSQLSALPYITKFVVGLLSSLLSDYIVKNKVVGVTNARKIFQSLGSFISAAALIYLAFLENFEKDLIVVLLVIAVATSAFEQSGYLVNIIDIAPNHSGTVLGITNGSNQLFSLLAPLTVGFLGKDKTDPMLWRKVFLLAAGLYIGCGMFYVIFTSSEVQSWNNIEDEKEKESQKENETATKEKI